MNKCIADDYEQASEMAVVQQVLERNISQQAPASLFRFDSSFRLYKNKAASL